MVALQKGETPQRLENPDHPAHKSKDSLAASLETVTNSFGSLRVDHTGMTYVSGAHWTALQDSVCVKLPVAVIAAETFTDRADERGDRSPSSKSVLN